MSYGRPHRRRVAELDSPYGQPCPFPFCGLPMLPGQRLQADHVIPVALGGVDSPLRWAHGRCNERAGAAMGNRLRGRGRKWGDRWA